MFQFYLSSIKRLRIVVFSMFQYLFQFYLSSIKSSDFRKAQIASLMFQFYLSSIKSFLVVSALLVKQGFNSTLVQLKVGRH